MRPLSAARVFLVMAAAGCALPGPATALSSPPFVGPKEFAITPPTGWRVFHNSYLGADVIFVDAPQDGFTANVNVVVTTAPPGAAASPVKALHQTGTQIRAALSRQFTHYALLSQGALTVAGAPALQMASSYSLGTPPKAITERQVYILRHGVCYIVTLTALSRDYPHDNALFTAMLRSLHWTKKPR